MNLKLMEVAAPQKGLLSSPLAPISDWKAMGDREHFVQFYEDDRFLMESVHGFGAAGLRDGESFVVIATEKHRSILEKQLHRSGFDLEALLKSGRYQALDAVDTLSKFMVGDLPDERCFRQVVGAVVDRAAQSGKKVRAFGEMVAVLWKDGKGLAAIHLEELWNNLGETRPFSLFCAYPINGFTGASNGVPFAHICRTHSRVIPAESYVAEKDADQRLRDITLLQQKAKSLEAEVEEHKRTEAALLEQKEKLSMAAAVGRLGIWEMDEKTLSLTGSVEFFAHFGLTPRDHLTFEHFSNLIHVEDRSMVEKTLRAAMEGKAEFSIEFRVVSPEGKVRWIASIGKCQHDHSHRMLGVTLDVTDRKRTAEVFERTVADRTRELHETIAELEAFSYSISHDMRAPLRSIRGFADILMEECADKLGADYQNYLERIVAAGDRMDRLIQDVLSFSRVARTELHMEPVNMDHLVRGIIECYPDFQYPESTITIDGQLPYVIGNAAALTQCISNLLGNAVKFVPRGTEPQVHIWAETVSEPSREDALLVSQSMIRIYIKDNGIGIPKESHEKIFCIFQRLNRNYEGTGIGLAIVKKAAERMGGRVGLVSEVGNGSTFWIELKPASFPLK